MATKAEELKTGCLSRVEDEEPIFILRAQDILAPRIIEHWVMLATNIGVNPEKCKEALALAEQMRKWPKRKLPD